MREGRGLEDTANRPVGTGYEVKSAETILVDDSDYPDRLDPHVEACGVPWKQSGTVIVITSLYWIDRHQQWRIKVEYIDSTQPQHDTQRASHCETGLEHPSDHEPEA